jgi:hypothetical protein
MVFTILVVFLRRKPKLKFLFDFMKSLTTSENLSSNPLQRKRAPGFQKPLVNLNVVPKAACDPKNGFRKPAINVHWRK